MPKKIAKQIKYVVEGRGFYSLPEIATEYGMSADAVYKRYSRGCIGDDLVPGNKRKSYVPQSSEPISTEFTINGRRFKSAMQACAELGVKYVTYRKRLDRGLTVEQSLGLTDFNDKREKGAKRHAIMDGDKKPKKRTPIVLTAYGKTYFSYKELADDYGIKNYVVRDRIVNYGYSAEEAVGESSKSKKVKVGDKEYPSLTAAAHAHNLTLPILLGRLGNEQTLEEALGLIRKETDKVVFQGQTYENLNALALNKNIRLSVLKSRLDRGLKLEDAVDAGSRITNKGRYNKTILQRDGDLGARSSILYFIKLKISEIIYFKVGITTQSVYGRFKGNKNLDIEVIFEKKGTLEDMYFLEQSILKEFRHKLAKVSAEVLDGHTEIFELSDQEVDEVLLRLTAAGS